MTTALRSEQRTSRVPPATVERLAVAGRRGLDIVPDHFLGDGCVRPRLYGDGIHDDTAALQWRVDHLGGFILPPEDANRGRERGGVRMADSKFISLAAGGLNLDDLRDVEGRRVEIHAVDDEGNCLGTATFEPTPGLEFKNDG
jgi:hypothetical protein